MNAKENANDALARARTWLKGLDAGKRSNLVKFSIVGLGSIVLLIAYYASGRDEDVPNAPKARVSTIELGDSRLEDDIRAQVERERQEARNENTKQDKNLEEQSAKLEAQSKQIEIMTQALQAMQTGAELGAPGADEGAKNNREPLPDDPVAWAEGRTRSGASLRNHSASPAVEPAAPVPVTFVGGIGRAALMPSAAPPGAAGATKGATKAPEQGGKKNSRKFFLPTSFMAAKLLTGLKAKTVESAKEDPEPMLLRVQAPAVLPNDVRAQLQGCFVIAHGYGSLASERVEARLVSLSCIDYEGRSIIEQEIVGIVVDKDGVKGLAGRPVTKMGANLARMFVAGLVEGAGEAVEQSATITSVSPLGQTQTVDTDKLARAGGGRGVSKAAGELSKIYADLVRQSAPVIEIGPSKDVSVLITQGVWLEVSEYAPE